MLILLLILATCAAHVSHTKNNYYVIEIPSEIEDQILAQIKKPFTVYWNVPTMQCASKKILFQNLYEKFGITQNTNDSFVGDKIAILYLDSYFPKVSGNKSGQINDIKNGGVPQLGDLKYHLQEIARIVNDSIPDSNFDGVGVLDLENWRPIFRQNFQSSSKLAVYQNLSIDIERETHWWWTETRIQEEARMRFEESARRFMQTTLSLVKEMRPKARWGYYGLPLCFNKITEECSSELVLQENSRISWLWEESTAVYPSVYSYGVLPPPHLAAYIRGGVNEGLRVKRNDAPIIPYFNYMQQNEFFSENDLNTAIETFCNLNVPGFIIWGASRDVNTVEKCKKLYEYVEQVLGPAVAKYTKLRTVRALDASMISCMKDGKVNALENISISVSTPEKYCGENSMIVSTNITMNNPFNGVAPNIFNLNIINHIDFYAGTANNYVLKNNTAKQGVDIGNAASTNFTINFDSESSTKHVTDAVTNSDIERSTTEGNYDYSEVTDAATLDYTVNSDLETSTVTDGNYDYTKVTDAEALDHTINSDLENSTATDGNYDYTKVTEAESLDYTSNSDSETSTATKGNYDYTTVTEAEALDYTSNFDLEISTATEGNYDNTKIPRAATLDYTSNSDLETSTATKGNYDYTKATDAEALDYISNFETGTSTATGENYDHTKVTAAATLDYTINSDLETSIATDGNHDYIEVTDASTLDYTSNSDLETSTATEGNYDYTKVTDAATLDYTINSDLETSTATDGNHDNIEVTDAATLDCTSNSDLETSTATEGNYNYREAETLDYTRNFDSNDNYGEYHTSNPEEIIESDPEFHYISREDSTQDLEKTKYNIYDPVVFSGLVSNFPNRNNISLHDIVMQGTNRKKKSYIKQI